MKGCGSLLFLAGLLFAGAVVPSAASAAPADGQERYRTVHLLHFAGLEGEFDSLQCSRHQRGRVDFSNFVQEVRVARETGATLVVSSGNILGDSPFFDFMLRQGESGIATVAGMLKETGAALFVPGHSEFAIPYRMFLEFLPDFERGGIAFGIANLKCGGEDESCKRLAAAGTRVVEVEGIRFGLVGLVGPRVASVVHPANVRGLEFTAPVLAAKDQAERLRREESVDLVVAVVNLEVEEGSTQETMAFLRDAQGVDVVVAGGLLRSGRSQPLLTAASAGAHRTVLAGSPRAPNRVGRLTLKLERKGRSWVIDETDAMVRRVSTFRRVESIARLLAQAVSEFCSLAQRTLGRGQVQPAMTWTDFANYVLEILRRQFQTDLAVLSAESLKLDRDASIKGPITSGLLSKAFARHEVVLVSVEGPVLAGFIKSYFADSNAELRAYVPLRGASMEEDGSVSINNRPVNEKRRYTIATTDYLASGSKGYLAALLGSARTRKEPSSYFLQEVAHRFFEKELYARGEDGVAINLESNFAPLWNKPLWEMSFGLNGSLTNVSIDNAGSYSETQLASRSPNTGVKGDSQARVVMTTRDHRVSEFLNLQYGMVQIGEGDLDETQDLITQELLYSWTRLRNLYGQGRLWVPAPVVKGQIETEFSRAPTVYAQEEDEVTGSTVTVVDEDGNPVPAYDPYHHFEVTGVAGLEWVFDSRASAGVGYGIRKELFATAGSERAELEAGIQLYYQIAKLPLYTWDTYSGLTFDSRAELFYSDWGGNDTVKAIGSSKLMASVLGPLSFTVGLDFFVFRSGDGGLAYAIDTMVGLAFGYEAGIQTF